MKLKLDDAGHVVVQDGKPVYTHDDGKDVPFDAPGTVATISRLNGEAKSHREGKEAAEKLLKGFEGISDPAAAIEALKTVANLDGKRLVDAGEVQKVKDEAIKAVRAEYEPIVAERDKLKGDLYGEKIGGAFARSKFAEDKVAVPRHMLQKTYGDAFKIEDGKVVAYDANGAKIYSRAKPGELADFDEALELLVSADPYKDHILKGTGAQGGGAGQGGGSGGGAKTMSRSQFEKLQPVEQAAKMKDGFTLTEG
jgi:hypothetical protein